VGYELTDEQVDLLEEAAWNNGNEGDVRYDYSGRGMYGKKCVGLDVPSVRTAVKTLVALAESDSDLASDLAGAWTQDSMGLGVIVYFPGFTVKDPDEGEEKE
jgi:hypothetical protein